MLLRQQRPYLSALAIAALMIVIALGIANRSPDLPAPARPAGRLTTTDQIIFSYQELARNEPYNPDAHAILGAAYLQKARESADPAYYERAQQVLDTAVGLDPQHIDALVGQGALALARHRFAEALALGQRARANGPNVARVYGVIADAQIELGMYDQAVETIQTMVDLRPDLGSYSRVAYIRELFGDLDGAIEAMDLAVRAGGPTRENTEWTRVQLGHLFFARGDLSEAEAQYQRSLVMLPDYVHALGGLARVRAAQGDVDAAIALYRQAITRVPLPELVIGLAETLDAAGRSEEAAEQYELVRAMQKLFAASGVDTDLELARFEADHGDPGTAVTLARAAYERRPSIGAADALAWALARADSHVEARRYVEEAMRLGTRDALIFFHAGMIARSQGDATAARSYLEQALALNPYFSPIYAPVARETLSALASGSERDS